MNPTLGLLLFPGYQGAGQAPPSALFTPLVFMSGVVCNQITELQEKERGRLLACRQAGPRPTNRCKL